MLQAIETSHGAHVSKEIFEMACYAFQIENSENAGHCFECEWVDKALMEAYFYEGIHNYEDTIQQFTGDGVVILFGVPTKAGWNRLKLLD